MASAGLRRGALPCLRIQDLQKIQKYDLYKISVYKKEQEQYTTFWTPECTKYIDQYLNWRRRLGEKTTPELTFIPYSIRPDQHRLTNLNQSQPHVVICRPINTLLEAYCRYQLDLAKHQLTELMQTHGFRKFFKTTCINGRYESICTANI